jgi:hypothetical protein
MNQRSATDARQPILFGASAVLFLVRLGWARRRVGRDSMRQRD